MSRAEWEEARKTARQLEGEIDRKLSSFAKMVSSVRLPSDVYLQRDTAPLIDHNEVRAEGLLLELEHSLSKLREVNDKMGELTIGGKLDLGATAQHTVQRHRDVLQDYMQEFNRTKENLTAIMQRQRLLGDGVRLNASSSSTVGGGASTNSRRNTELLLKEHDHIKNSERLVDEQIEVAIGIKENLTSQRDVFKQIHSRMLSMTNRFPVLNSLMQRIQLRKRRDSIIIAAVISCCILFLLLYKFH